MIEQSNRTNVKPQEPALPKTSKRSEAESELLEISCLQVCGGFQRSIKINPRPYAGVSDDEFMFMYNDYELCQQQVFHQFDELSFHSFKYSDYGAHDQENKIDPDNNFYNYTSSNCKYYSDQKCN